MKIKEIRTYHVSKPLAIKLPNSCYTIETIEHILVEVDTEEYTGIGFVYSINAAHAEAMRCMIRDYAQHLIGKESDMIRQHLQLANMINAPSGQMGFLPALMRPLTWRCGTCWHKVQGFPFINFSERNVLKSPYMPQEAG